MTEDALLKAVLADPLDDAPRLIMADWLDERGGPGDVERGEFIRVQIALARRFGVPTDGAVVVTGDLGADCEEVALCHRELELVAILEPYFGEVMQGLFVGRFMHGWRWRRGFVETVTYSAEDWLRQAGNIYPDLVPGTILAAHPVREVRLTTTPMLYGDGGWQGLQGDHGGKMFLAARLNASLRRGESLLMGLLRYRWPGVAFTLPSGESGLIPSSEEEIDDELREQLIVANHYRPGRASRTNGNGPGPASR